MIRHITLKVLWTHRTWCAVERRFCRSIGRIETTETVAHKITTTFTDRSHFTQSIYF